MGKVLFIINPVSGGQEKDLVLELISEMFSERGFVIMKTSGDNDKAKIAEFLAKEPFDIAVAGGGDGTVAMLADVVKDKKQVIGILPLGSANGLATELEVPKEAEESLRLIRDGKPKPFDLIQINDRWNVLHLADIGLNATLVKRYQEDEHRGFLGYAISALKELPNIDEPMEMEIIADNKRYTFQSHFLGIANAKKYGTGVIINPEGKIDDGRFELCVLNEISFGHLLENFVGDVKPETSPFSVISAKHAIVKIKPPTDFQIDGEYMGEIHKLEVKVAPVQLQLIY